MILAGVRRLAEVGRRTFSSPVALAGGVAVLTLAAHPDAPRDAPPDTIFTGSIITLDSARPRVEAIAVREGTIVAVGTRSEVERFAAPTTQRVTLPGIALPGFGDSHTHPVFLGETMEMVDVRGLSKAATLAKVRSAATTTPPGQWVRGTGWDQGRWQPADFPTAADLDSVSAGHPIMLDRVDGHAAWLNTRALQLASLGRDHADTVGGRIVRDARGVPTGVLVDNAMDFGTRALPTPAIDIVERRLRAGLAQYAKWGLTSEHDAGEDSIGIAAYRRLAERGELPVRAYVMALYPTSAVREVLAASPDSGLGHRMLTIRSIKVLADGALGSRGAQLSSPYSDAPGERGLIVVADRSLDSLIRVAAARGFQVNIHAIGDEAVHRVLDAFARAGPAARALRFRVEHVSMVRDEDVPRFAALGVIASMQPVFVGEYGRFVEARVGAGRLPWVYRTRDLLESGARIASGTDFPTSDAGDPISTLYTMVTRHAADGAATTGPLGKQGLSVDQALRSMTAGVAYAAFQERELGALTVGRAADLTVLSANPYTIPPDSLRSLVVRMTVVGGRVVYRQGVGSSE